MANFTYTTTANITTSDNVTISLTQGSIPANGKELLDDTFVGATVDLAPLLSSIDEPANIIIKSSGTLNSGFKMAFDGGTPTVKAFQLTMLRISPNSIVAGDLDIELQLQGTDTQRIQVLALGDPS